MKKPSVSVIIPTLDEEAYIGDLLSDLLTNSGIDFEVIVADCNSSDSTISVVKSTYPAALITKTNKQSPGAARNVGVKISSGEKLLFIDADVRIYKNFIATMATYLDSSASDIIYPRFRSDGKSFGGFVHMLIVNLWLLFYRKLSSDKGIGGVIMCTKEAYDTIEGFDETHAGEDVDFYEKAHKKKLKISICKNVKAKVSSRRTKGLGFFITAYEDMRIFSKLNIKRSYSRYK